MEKINFCPRNSSIISLVKTYEEIIRDFNTTKLFYALRTPGKEIEVSNIQDHWEKFYNEITEFIISTYGEPQNPLTVGEIIGLYKMYQSLNN
jgi:hypothetical protein